MRTITANVTLIAFGLGLFGTTAQAQKDPHPTLTAMHRYGHRKTAHAVYTVNHAGAHLHNWKHRKAHNFRAWLNKH